MEAHHSPYALDSGAARCICCALAVITLRAVTRERAAPGTAVFSALATALAKGALYLHCEHGAGSTSVRVASPRSTGTFLGRARGLERAVRLALFSGQSYCALSRFARWSDETAGDYPRCKSLACRCAILAAALPGLCGRARRFPAVSHHHLRCASLQGSQRD